jgi:large subunit ribosomal protein L21
MKAIIKSGNTQFVVSEKDTIFVDHLDGKKVGDKLEFDALALIDGAKTQLGKGKVSAKVLEELVKDEKVIAIRFKAKKRVNKKRGFRHQYTQIQIEKIA